MEDVIQIILNLKKVRFIAHKDGEFKAKVEVKGEKVVTAKDIKTGSSVEVVNTDQIIATLTDKKADFEMDLTIEKGVGYQMSEERERREKEIGVIEIDSIFSPVNRVNLEVENMRVGKRTDFEKLILTVETDGTITPDEALRKVNAILVSQFSQLTTLKNIKEVEKGKPIVTEEASEKAEEADEAEELPVKKGGKFDGVNVLELPIQKLKIPARTSNSLIEQNFKSIGDLAVLSEEEILQIEGMGEKGLRDIKKALGNYGLVLENEEDKELDRKKKSGK
jgi:DNA-directed RNA polymerase subunit alpha